MKTIVKFLAVTIAMASMLASAQNLTTNITTGITFISAGATSNALSTAIIETKNHEEVAVEWNQIYSSTNVDAAANKSIATFGGGTYPSNLVAIATVTNSVGNTATTAKTVGANIYIGSYRFFGLMSISNGGTNTTATNYSILGTNGVMTFQFKDKRNGL